MQDAEARARQAEEERELYAALAEEEEAKRVNNRQALEAAQRRIADLERRHAEQMAALQARVAPPTPQEAEQVVERTNEAAAQINLDEAATRRLIDEQLRAAGWEADSEGLRHAAGARPQKAKNLAIAEWPTASGPADYVLFTGTRALGVVEAKKRRRDVSAALAQSKRYSEGFAPKDGAEAAGGPWGKYRVPFLFATNGRRYFKQLETKSGIWFLDARRPQNLSSALPDWYTPEGLDKLLAQDIDAANRKLADEPTDYLDLREYQIRAIHAVEGAVAEGERSCLVAMVRRSRGTGRRSTRTMDHEPLVSLVTKLAEEGINWDKGAQVPLFDPPARCRRTGPERTRRRRERPRRLEALGRPKASTPPGGAPASPVPNRCHGVPSCVHVPAA